MDWLLIVLGLLALYFGGEWLVRGSSALALKLGIPALLVGLTVVAYGTSAPELVVSLIAISEGKGDIAAGNVIGSNIFNIGVILAITAIVAPVRVNLQIIKFDGPFLLVISGLFAWLFWNGELARWQGAVLLGLVVAYTAVNVWLARRGSSAEVDAEFAEGVDPGGIKPLGIAALIFGGLVVLVVGSRLFVTGAVGVARELGVSEAVIGLTIVAAGTSMPELASSLVAALRKQADIAIGNVVGSNVFNLLMIGGISGVVANPLAAPNVASIDFVAMILFALVLLPIAWTGLVLKRWEGILLLALYGVYLALMWPSGTGA